MNRIVVSDIFGRTHALEEICSIFSGNTEIVDPYNGKFMEFQDECEAYSYFMNNVGLDKYCDVLLDKIFRTPHTVQLLGFSVGASVIWQLSENVSPSKVLGAVCFYGSQIRKLANINPGFQIKIVLPAKEDTFSVADLARILSQKKNIKIYESDYLHGFMNKKSNNYNLSGYNQYLQWLQTCF
ncbi:MAG: dienelactone hydrolase [Desulforhopalus sp.]|jgi:dienelactone hydrolase